MKQQARTIGMVTIGQAPRDDVVPAMRSYLPANLHIVQYGALDELDTFEIDRYLVRDGEVGIVTTLLDGSSVLLSHELILPAMQAKVDRLVDDDNVELIVILCGADWSALKADRLIVNPGTLFPSIITSLAAGRRLGIIKPSSGQIEKERERYRSLGIDTIVTAASPYAGPDRLRLAREAAEELSAANCDLVWMTCVGMDAAMRDVVAEVTGKPVILAHSLLARIITELISEPAGVPVA